ncbi:MAG: hypothetical protein MK102_16260 [Fuerstiella sp.]|nr:hypothetical protein [Fuerstiella sp.]
MGTSPHTNLLTSISRGLEAIINVKSFENREDQDLLLVCNAVLHRYRLYDGISKQPRLV